MKERSDRRFQATAIKPGAIHSSSVTSALQLRGEDRAPVYVSSVRLASADR